ncbi:hypothetical protein FRB97_004255 [Tulasnella sp. 331]|nr:hypothetical protein FRB97_004255 [Tulasnella sp. 331]
MVRFLRPLAEADWVRFHTIAPRVRVVHMEGYYLRIDSSLLVGLYLTNPKPLPLLPNIRDLRHMDCELALLFMSPTLRYHELHISSQPGQPEPPTLPRFFARMAALAMNLAALEISVDGHVDMSKEAVCGLAGMLRRLQKLRIATLHISNVIPDAASILTPLSELQELEEIQITCHELSIAAGSLPTERPFPALRKLVLCAGLISGVSLVLKRMVEYSRLNCLVIGDGAEETDVDVGEALQSLQGHRNLRSVSVAGPRNPTYLSYPLLEPISGLSDLKNLTVYVSGPCEMTDEELQMLASAFPQLRTLHLRHRDTESPPTLTINILPRIIHSCPFIRSIEISHIDALSPVVEMIFPASSTLRLLSVGKARIQDAQAVALFIDRLSDRDTFKVQSEYWLEETKEAQRREKLWEEVELLIPALQKARHYERARIQALSYTAVKKEAIKEEIRNQIAAQNAQELINKINEKCYEKCVPKPSTGLGSSEEVGIVVQSCTSIG